MYPHERSLVKRLEGKPFALVGINSDAKERVQEAIKKENITWRSWWDGGSTGGPIASAWGITGWPTMFVLDHKGVVRFQFVGFGSTRGEELDKAIDQLLSELAADTKEAKKP